jgi:SAM-dependent methyltransferase
MGVISRIIEKLHGGAIQRYRHEMEPFEREALRAARVRMLADMTGHLLEIGAGLGQSFPYYPKNTQVTALEPFDIFRAEAQREAKRSELRINVVDGDAQRLQYPDAHFDGLFCSIVLCSVRDPALALREMHRVLRPGSPARFLEHVRSSSKVGAALQYGLTPLWAAFDGSGCSITRRPIEPIKKAGFKIDRIAHLTLPGIFGVIFPGVEIYARA